MAEFDIIIGSRENTQMATEKWMLYGAYGFTGRLIVEEALQRGHRPLLAGRSAEKLLPLAERTGLEAHPIDLADGAALRAALAEFDLVFHAAGPYIHTSRPMLSACLDTHTHYVDITGELPVFEHTLSLDEDARRAGICLVSGAGFDVVPTDCLAVTLAHQVTQPEHLELAIAGAGGGISAGTMKSAIEIFAGGGLARRNGELVAVPLGSVQRVQFPHGMRLVMNSPLGDLITAYASTSIPNITTYLATTPLAASLAPRLHALLQSARLRRWVSAFASRMARGPSRTAQHTHSSYTWGRVTGKDGQTVEGTLELPEPYRFTALAAVRAVEHVLEHQPVGALTPTQAFGADFIKQF
jgi:short subunit dehydrogenase-like uncharacterized protein